MYHVYILIISPKVYITGETCLKEWHRLLTKLRKPIFGLFWSNLRWEVFDNLNLTNLTKSLPKHVCILIAISSVPYLVNYLSISVTSDLVFQFNLKICKLCIINSVSGVAYFLLTTVYLVMNSVLSLQCIWYWILSINTSVSGLLSIVYCTWFCIVFFFF